MEEDVEAVEGGIGEEVEEEDLRFFPVSFSCSALKLTKKASGGRTSGS